MTTYFDPRKRAAFDTALYRLEGKRVTGHYFGVPFTGTVVETRQHTCNYRPELTVALDTPITVYSAVRERIIVDAHGIEHDNQAIAEVTGGAQ